jgi:hypothetical protein
MTFEENKECEIFTKKAFDEAPRGTDDNSDALVTMG